MDIGYWILDMPLSGFRSFWPGQSVKTSDQPFYHPITSYCKDRQSHLSDPQALTASNT